MRLRTTLLTLTVTCLLGACGSASSHDAQPAVAAAQRAAGSKSTMCAGSPAAKPVSHVVWIWMENHSAGSLLGKPGSSAAHQAPFLNGTLTGACAVATNYFAIGHPSLPNYIAATSGATHGISDDCDPRDCAVDAASVFGQVEQAGLQWRSYAESMSGTCNLDSTGRYAARHNPAVYYVPLASSCAGNDQPMGTLTSGAFARDLDGGTLHAFSFVAPNLCNDTHDCSIAVGDTWLRSWVSRIVRSKAYGAGDVAVFVVWDEGEIPTFGGGCTKHPADCHVPLVVIAPGVRHAIARARADHYTLLRTTEQLLHLPPLGNAAKRSSFARQLHLAGG